MGGDEYSFLPDTATGSDWSPVGGTSALPVGGEISPLPVGGGEVGLLPETTTPASRGPLGWLLGCCSTMTKGCSSGDSPMVQSANVYQVPPSQDDVVQTATQSGGAVELSPQKNGDPQQPGAPSSLGDEL